ncbi:hypothetical protein ACCT03_33695 [Rhizobium johnstonii]|uniref:hypothetical protein n=1 Tax=Rhizobium TaxID=379 RepID=UPI00102F9607|nr:hypothetical protein [Rhizobium leguminosarum]TBF22327.1 hypothetical protein ELG92_35330 [Rhizobium leguminosarum]TBH45437.1 hypothetical protein ELG65_37870 [Rhizobium leguminosarum]
METTRKLHPGQPFQPITLSRLDGDTHTFGGTGSWEALLFIVVSTALDAGTIWATAASTRPLTLGLPADTNPSANESHWDWPVSDVTLKGFRMNSNQRKVSFRWSAGAIKEHSRIFETSAGRRKAIQLTIENELIETVQFAGRYRGACVVAVESDIFVYGTKRDFNEPALYVVEKCVGLLGAASAELRRGLLDEYRTRKQAVSDAAGLEDHSMACVAFSHFMQVLDLIVSNVADCVGDARIARIVLAWYRRGVEKILRNEADSEDQLATLGELIDSLKMRLSRVA